MYSISYDVDTTDVVTRIMPTGQKKNGDILYLPEIYVDSENIDAYPHGHVGYYVGNGYVIEWRGFNFGCVRTKLSGRKWTHWYRLPWIDYGEGALTSCIRTVKNCS